MKGMIVYSFGIRPYGNSMCNIRLAIAAKRIIEKQEGQVFVITQRSIGQILKKFDVGCHTVQKKVGHEDTKEVTKQAAEIFKEKNITEVIPVAQPFLHLTQCIHLIRKAGFKIPYSFFKLAWMTGWIGFDPLSVQPWTRGPCRLVIYTIRKIFGYKPPPDLSE